MLLARLLLFLLSLLYSLVLVGLCSLIKSFILSKPPGRRFVTSDIHVLQVPNLCTPQVPPSRPQPSRTSSWAWPCPWQSAPSGVPCPSLWPSWPPSISRWPTASLVGSATSQQCCSWPCSGMSGGVLGGSDIRSKSKFHMILTKATSFTNRIFFLQISTSPSLVTELEDSKVKGEQNYTWLFIRVSLFLQVTENLQHFVWDLWKNCNTFSPKWFYRHILTFVSIYS